MSKKSFKYRKQENKQVVSGSPQKNTNESKLSLFCLDALEYLWLVAIFIIPFLIIPNVLPTTLKLYFFAIIVLIMFFFWTVRIFETRKIDFKLNTLGILVLLFFGAMALSTIFSLAPDLSFWGSERRQGLVTFILYILFFVMVASSLRKKKQIEHIITTLIVAGFVNGVMAILQYNDMNFFPTSKEMLMENGKFRAYGNTGNPLFLAGWLVMIIPLTAYRVYDYILRKGWKNFWLYCYVAVLFMEILAVFLTFTRGAIFAFGITLFIAMIIIAAIKKIRWLWISGLVIFLFAGASIVSLNMPSNPLRIPKNNIITMRFSNLWSETSSFYSRTLLWKLLAKPIKEHILVGVGPDAFGPYSYSKEYFDKELMKLEMSNFQKRLDRAHNIILDSMLSTGIIGTMLFMGIFIYVFIILLKNIFKPKSETYRYLSLAVLLAIAAYFLQGLTSFSEVMMYSLLFLLFAVVYFMEISSFEDSSSNLNITLGKTQAVFRSPWLYILIVPPLVLFLIYLINPMLQAETDYNKAMKLLSDKNTQKEGQELMISAWERYPRLEKTNMAVLGLVTNSADENKMKWFESELLNFKKKMPEELFFPFMLAETYHKWGELKKDESKFQASEKVLDEAFNVYGNKYPLYTTYIFILADRCDFELVDAKIAEALDFSTYLKGQYYLYAAKGAVGCGNFDKAIEYLEEIKDVHDVVSYSGKFDMLGKIYVEKKEMPKAVENWKKCLEVNASDTNCLGNLAIYYANEDNYEEALQYAEKLDAVDQKKGGDLIQQITNLKNSQNKQK